LTKTIFIFFISF